MRSLFILIAAVCAVAPGKAWADIKPADGGAPIFQIFAASPSRAGGPAKIDISGQKPLMVVSAVSNVKVSKDHKAVGIILTRSDARRFADITRKHAKELLILEGNGKVLTAMRVTSPVTDGVLEFTYPDDAAVADYLRNRFRLK
jgi:hypothetical protein